MKVLLHHIYEYRKGLRNLVLHTIPEEMRDEAVLRFQKYGIDYYIQELDSQKINIFFGSAECVDIIKSFGRDKLYQFTDEEDFILGIMLGYSRIEQCRRYIKRRNRRRGAA